MDENDKINDTDENRENNENEDIKEEQKDTDAETEENTESEEPEDTAAEPDDAMMPDIKMTQEMLDAEYFLPEDKKRISAELFDWIEIFSSALVTVILLFTFIVRLVTVQGASMEQTLHEKDSLIISHLFYGPKAGDIVVIQVPNPQYDTPLIKRVIATEGQTVDFDFENWQVIVDGKAVDEPYVNFEYPNKMKSDDIVFDSLPITVEKGKIFVMGDNRNHSSDSRSSSIGQVDVRNVVGRVLVRVFPFNKFGIVKPNE